MKRSAVFLDRDGVLNRALVRNGKPYMPARIEEFEILDEARAACRALKARGMLLICITNQPELARGGTDWATVDEINRQLLDVLRLDEVLVCAHDDADNCHCRKPKPGLLTSAARTYSLDLSLCFTVGDRWRDIEAGRAAGTRTVFIDRGYHEKKPERADYVTTSVADAAEWIVALRRS